MSDALSWEESAALPEALATAWLNLVVEGGLTAGERVLVHAGGSGVGTVAIQVARLRGGRVWVTAGSDDKLERCRALGAEGGHNRHHGSHAQAIAAWTEGRGVDLILSPVGGASFEDDLHCLAAGGRLVVIGILGGRTAEIDLGRLLVKRLTVVGSVLRSRSDVAKTELVRQLRDQVWPAVLDGTVRAPIHAVFPIAEAERAHALVDSDQTFGKVVLTV